MTEEEFFRENYPDSCYGDKPLSPHWDFFQDGVAFGERQSEKKIAELQKDNDACHKDNERVVKKHNELSAKNKELQEELDYAKSNCLFSDCDRAARLKSQNVDLEKENARLKIKAREIIRGLIESMQPIKFEEDRQRAITKAKQFLKE